MLVSVVIPVFNRAEQIRRAVCSVLDQRDIELELIVVDDGSTDATPQVLQSIHDQRMRVIRLKSNRGVSFARNYGLKNAKGDFLALLDSDDWWLPGKMAGHLRYHQEGGWRISQTDEIWIRHGRRVNPRDKHAKPLGWFFADALKMCLISPSCVLFDRAFWNEIGPFDEDMPACEDYDLWLRTLIRYPVGLCPDKLVCKTGGHADQLSRRIIGLDLYRLRSLDKLLRTADLTTEQRDLTVRELQARAGLYVRGCLKRDKAEEAQRIKAWLKCWI